LTSPRRLPGIRRKTRQHLKLPGLPKQKVLAAIVQIMEKTLIRVGNEEYAKNNNSYGLTTLQDKHAKIRSNRIEFKFKGKSGIDHQIDLKNPQLAQIAKKCQDLPGQELFQYLDDSGKVCDIGSTDVNDYLRSLTGQDFTAKDFRTWAGTVLAAQALQEIGSFTTQKQAKSNVVRAVESVAKALGNTKAVCRKCYIHPAILQSYLDGQLSQFLAAKANDLAQKAKVNQKDQEGSGPAPAAKTFNQAIPLQGRLVVTPWTAPHGTPTDRHPWSETATPPLNHSTTSSPTSSPPPLPHSIPTPFPDLHYRHKNCF
jgi:DNA topoisomerase-1